MQLSMELFMAMALKRKEVIQCSLRIFLPWIKSNLELSYFIYGVSNIQNISFKYLHMLKMKNHFYFVVRIYSNSRKIFLLFEQFFSNLLLSKFLCCRVDFVVDSTMYRVSKLENIHQVNEINNKPHFSICQT